MTFNPRKRRLRKIKINYQNKDFDLRLRKRLTLIYHFNKEDKEVLIDMAKSGIEPNLMYINHTENIGTVLENEKDKIIVINEELNEYETELINQNKDNYFIIFKEKESKTNYKLNVEGLSELFYDKYGKTYRNRLRYGLFKA